jgi:hypothetical protein
LVLGEIRGHTIVFISLERIGGIMVYDVTNPINPSFLNYCNNRDFAAAPNTPETGDLGPEGMVFVPAAQSPIQEPILIVANEVSGTTTIFKITSDLPTVE